MKYDELIAKYITTAVVEGVKYWVLIMKEYNVYSPYKCDKYSILEIIQDIDTYNRDNGCPTNYYDTFCPKPTVDIRSDRCSGGCGKSDWNCRCGAGSPWY